MLVFVERYIRHAADKLPEIVSEAINPECIERVRARDAESVDVRIGDEWVRCVGTVEQFVKAANLIFEAPDDGSGGVSPPDNDPA